MGPGRLPRCRTTLKNVEVSGFGVPDAAARSSAALRSAFRLGRLPRCAHCLRPTDAVPTLFQNWENRSPPPRNCTRCFVPSIQSQLYSAAYAGEFIRAKSRRGYPLSVRRMHWQVSEEVPLAPTGALPGGLRPTADLGCAHRVSQSGDSVTRIKEGDGPTSRSVHRHRGIARRPLSLVIFVARRGWLF